MTRTHCRAIALHKYTAVLLSSHALMEQVNLEELTDIAFAADMKQFFEEKSLKILN